MEGYRRMKRMVKRMVREAKKRVNEEWTSSIAYNFKENKKKVWGKRSQKGGKFETIIYEKFDGKGVNPGE